MEGGVSRPGGAELGGDIGNFSKITGLLPNCLPGLEGGERVGEANEGLGLGEDSVKVSACCFRCWARSRPDNTPGAGRRLFSIWRIRARRWLAWHRVQTMHEAGAARSSPAHVEPCNTCWAVSVGKTTFKILPTSAYSSQHAATNFGKVDRFQMLCSALMMGVAKV